MKQIIHLFFTTCLLSASVMANAGQVSSYSLDIEFTPSQSHMHGRATMTFKEPLTSGTNTFYLHAELEVDSVSLNGEDLEFKTEQVFYDSNYALVADKVSFDLAENIAGAELVVNYRGHFHPSAARSPSDYMRIGEDGVFLRAYGYSLWFPIFLGDNEDVYRADFPSVRFKVPRRYELIFVGERTAEQLTPTHAITTWRVDDATLWGLQVTAREFQQHKIDNVSIYHLDGEESRQAAIAVADFTQQLLAYFEQHYRQDAGVDNLNLLEMPKYGDISSHNMVGVSSDTFRSFDTAVYAKRTIAHELVHPFVSVQVSRSDPLWSLAVEGFPSYFHLPAMRQVLGEGFYDEFMLKIQDYYLRNKGVKKDRWDNARPPEVPLMQITADDMSDYKDDYILSGRTRLFFNYLLMQMGDEKFSAFASELFALARLTAEEFIALCKRHLPEKAAQIDTWLYSNDYPEEFRLN